MWGIVLRLGWGVRLITVSFCMIWRANSMGHFPVDSCCYRRCPMKLGRHSLLTCWQLSSPSDFSTLVTALFTCFLCTTETAQKPIIYYGPLGSSNNHCFFHSSLLPSMVLIAVRSCTNGRIQWVGSAKCEVRSEGCVVFGGGGGVLPIYTHVR